MTKKKLWIRKLSCGHERPTNIAFISGIYNKPKVGDKAYCRECWKEVEIVGVKEATKDVIKFLEKVVEEIQDKQNEKTKKIFQIEK